MMSPTERTALLWVTLKSKVPPELWCQNPIRVNGHDDRYSGLHVLSRTGTLFHPPCIQLVSPSASICSANWLCLPSVQQLLVPTCPCLTQRSGHKASMLVQCLDWRRSTSMSATRLSHLHGAIAILVRILQNSELLCVLPLQTGCSSAGHIRSHLCLALQATSILQAT